MFVVTSRAKVWTFQRPSIPFIVYDLGFPLGWLPSDPWPSVPIHVRFFWELAMGLVIDEIDLSATIQTCVRQYHNHMPPSALRAVWHDLAAPICSPCSPEQLDSSVHTDLRRS